MSDTNLWNRETVHAMFPSKATTATKQYRSPLYRWYLAVGKQKKNLGDSRSLYEIILENTDDDLYHGIISEDEEFHLFMDVLTAELNGEYA